MNTKSFLKDGIPTLKPKVEGEVSQFKLIDVRRPDEFTGELGHIKGAVLKTLGPELMEYLETADKDQPTLFICRSGVRSAQATGIAMDLGFKEVYNMEGGMLYWNAEVKPK
jgi:rhodanese-related sulfurtransferase